MTVADRVLRGILEGDPATLAGRGRLKAAIEARKLLVRARDPLVRHRIGATELLLPLSHELPFYRNDHPLYGEAVGRIAARFGGPVVDIGANVGDTAAVIRAHASVPVLCVEGDDVFFELLARNAPQLGDVELEHAFVDAPVQGTVERARGTARVVGGDGELSSKPLVRILDEHPRFGAARLVKLDTDGMDVPILDANLGVLADLRPVLFFEYDPYLGAEPGIFERLSGIGYRLATFYENTGEYRGAVSLIERSRLDELHELYSGHAGTRYLDVGVFHGDDAEAAARFVEAEESL